MWKGIAIIALTLGLEAGFLLNAALPAHRASDATEQAQVIARARAEQAREVARAQSRVARPDRS
jgi:hypothetical protein